MSKKIIQNKGFTLIELLFSIALIGFMLTIMLTTFIGVFRFYNWSKTTRNTQVVARDVLDTITKEVRSGKIVSASGSSMCINRTDGYIVNGTQVKTEVISVVSSQFQIEYYSDVSVANCNKLTQIGSPVPISPPNVKISNSKFSLVTGPKLPTGSNIIQPKSVVVSFTVVNGKVAADGKCAPGDNFCDLATFTTAVMER